ncbi:MAG: isochorismatase family protein [Acidobacteria bacterium]|nr:isochorismatase family protein [Acidobacteriota bacterium]
MHRSILITQCLQNDFVKPIGKYDPLPNLLHVGYEESRRLMGEDSANGAVARVMRWAYQQPDDELHLVHIRDWHSPDDISQASHLRQFGEHCVEDTPGASFVFPEPPNNPKRIDVVDSLTLNDFVGTRLETVLEPYRGTRTRVGIIGVWTEAKVTFLSYDLRTRFPDFEIAVCSALTASSSRAHHFQALDQLAKLLGVVVFSSVGEFVELLGGAHEQVPLPIPADITHPEITIEGAGELGGTDHHLIRYLFRDARSVKLRCLDGGFSGNLVLGSNSVDLYGHPQVPYVVKIGSQAPIGKERASFERVESVLGNNAPQITDFADYRDRGGIKYRYAAMGGGFSTTFQKRYCAGLSHEKIERYLKSVFIEQLGKFYQAAQVEKCNLMEYYCFNPQLALGVRKRVEELLGEPAGQPVLSFPSGRQFPNVCHFYEEDLARIMPTASGSAWFSYVHGDLNGANIIIDAQENVWLIDFFHTHRGHVLKDLAKLENDLLYIFTPVGDSAELDEALRLTDRLLGVEDLAAPLCSAGDTGLERPELLRAWRTIALLRSFYPSLLQHDRDPLQLLIAQMRYAMHTLSFDESNEWQKKWALYTGARCGAMIVERLARRGPLRLDWFDPRHTSPGRLGITILPGRRDGGRGIAADLATLRNQGVSHIVCLLSMPEFHRYGVDALLEEYRNAGMTVHHLPILDQSVSTAEEMRDLTGWIRARLAEGGTIAMHCVGGLGRSGMAAACWLKSLGLSPSEAIAEVRRIRTRRAIETTAQEAFVRSYEP